jgi:hypothetical protein
MFSNDDASKKRIRHLLCTDSSRIDVHDEDPYLLIECIFDVCFGAFQDAANYVVAVTKSRRPELVKDSRTAKDRICQQLLAGCVSCNGVFCGRSGGRLWHDVDRRCVACAGKLTILRTPGDVRPWIELRIRQVAEALLVSMLMDGAIGEHLGLAMHRNISEEILPGLTPYIVADGIQRSFYPADAGLSADLSALLAAALPGAGVIFAGMGIQLLDIAADAMYPAWITPAGPVAPPAGWPSHPDDWVTLGNDLHNNYSYKFA